MMLSTAQIDSVECQGEHQSMNREGRKGKRLWPNFGYYPGIWLEGPKKSPDRDLNPGASKMRSRTVVFRLQAYVCYASHAFLVVTTFVVGMKWGAYFYLHFFNF
jgi:hypothetical protein